MQIKLARLIPRLLLGCTLLVLLSGRWQLGMNRFFDVDEFSYLHWAAQVARGQIPYRDFFFFVPPGFQWAFAPLFWFVPAAWVFLVARGIHFGIFLGIILLTSALFGLIRSWRWALLPAVLLTFLPMPYDKFLEIRPDNLATLLALVGVVSQVWAIRTGSWRWWLVSGLGYGLSLLVLPKTVPFVLVGGVVWLVWNRWFGRAVPKARALSAPSILFLGGIICPCLVFLLWSLGVGFSTVWYSLTTMAIESNQLSKQFVMEAHLFFFPNGLFYGDNGFTLGFWANHAIWVVGLVVGCYRLLTPWITAGGDRRKALTEFFIAGIFFVSVWGYVEYVPLKHTQYLVPIAVFIALYAADGIALLYESLRGTLGWVIPCGILALGCIVILVANEQVSAPKRQWTNAVQLAQLAQARQLIPKDAQVLDLEGRMLFWTDPYYICCLPFGQFMQYLSRKPEPLSHVLEAKRVAYIYEGKSGRLAYLPLEDRSYIQSHYEAVLEIDGLLKRK